LKHAHILCNCNGCVVVVSSDDHGPHAAPAVTAASNGDTNMCNQSINQSINQSTFSVCSTCQRSQQTISGETLRMLSLDETGAMVAMKHVVPQACCDFSS